ncbi:MAG: phosphatidylglycerophosphatase A [Bacteroidota bacterium]
MATVFGIGYIQKGAGTVAALFCCIVWLLCHQTQTSNTLIDLICTAFIFFAGLWSSSLVEKNWGHDSNRIVIDELLGMCVALLFVPVSLTTVAIAFLFFRFFDIAKPLYIRRVEKLPGGWGVMTDDLLAGIYANLLLQIILLMKLL